MQKEPTKKKLRRDKWRNKKKSYCVKLGSVHILKYEKGGKEYTLI